MELCDIDIDYRCFEDEEEFEIVKTGDCEEENEFDVIVGQLEEIVMSEEFIELRETFMRQFSDEFSPDEENKLVYMDIFHQYISTIDSYIEAKLEGSDLDSFFSLLRERQDEIDGPLFEMLLSFSDFSVFKGLMLDYKQPAQLLVSGASWGIHLG